MQKPLPFPELEEERDRAQRVKQDDAGPRDPGQPALQRALPAWPWTRSAGFRGPTGRPGGCRRCPKVQGLNDLYVRFFRMAERRIVEIDRTGRRLLHLQLLVARRAVVYRDAAELLSGGVRRDPDRQSGMATASFRNTRPTGGPAETVFAIRCGQSPGIRRSVRRSRCFRNPAIKVHYWATVVCFTATSTTLEPTNDGRLCWIASTLLESIRATRHLQPSLPLGLPFKPMAVSDALRSTGRHYLTCFRNRFRCVKTNRDAFLVDIDIDRLKPRIADYFDRDLSHGEIARRYPNAMKNTTTAHRQAGSRLMTPAAVPAGRAPPLYAARAAVLQAASAATPERFVRRPPTPPNLPTAAWINPPKPNDKEPEMGQYLRPFRVSPSLTGSRTCVYDSATSKLCAETCLQTRR